MERLVDNRLHLSRTDWDATCFLRGQWDVLSRIKRIEKDLDHLIEAKKESMENVPI